MNTFYYQVVSIDGDYANLKRTDEESQDLKLVARALLPPQITEGTLLKYEWMQYEIVDEETLYISGGDLPVGMNIEYTLSDGYLALKMNGGAVMFTKE